MACYLFYSVICLYEDTDKLLKSFNDYKIIHLQYMDVLYIRMHV